MCYFAPPVDPLRHREIITFNKDEILPKPSSNYICFWLNRAKVDMNYNNEIPIWEWVYNPIEIPIEISMYNGM